MFLNLMRLRHHPFISSSPQRLQAHRCSQAILLPKSNHVYSSTSIDKGMHSHAGNAMRTLDQLDKQEITCTGTHSKHKYPGGVYNPPQNILQRLQFHGFNVDTDFGGGGGGGGGVSQTICRVRHQGPVSWRPTTVK